MEQPEFNHELPETPPHRIPGRGSSRRNDGRFERIQNSPDLTQIDADHFQGLQSKVKTEFFEDASESIVSENRSPDIPFRYSLNPYRGCSHGCSYCYARPSHEFLGFGAGLDFESKIMIKKNAGRLFRNWLTKRTGQIESVMMSGVTDCYQPAERHFQITRECLRMALMFRHPIQIITKNSLVLRDLDVISQLAKLNLTSVAISLTTMDQSLTRIMEPRTSSPQSRLKTIATLAEAGIPVMVMTAPVIPGINEQEIPNLLKLAAEAGATRSGYVALRLPLSVEPVFLDWLETHFPDRKQKIVERIMSMRNGKMSSSEFGERMRGLGIWADQISQIHRTFSKLNGLNIDRIRLRTDLFRNVDANGHVQQQLF